MTTERPEPPESMRFLWLFALAWAGGAVAYVPFLTILLPLRVVGFAGGNSVEALGLITFCGAVAASVGNILFGWLSDRSGTRRPWIAAGLVLTIALLLAVPSGRDLPSILILVVCWQLALNMMLGPLSAWAADRVPRRMTGYLGGLMALSPALGALSGVVATVPGFATADQRLWLVAAMVAACVAPALLLAPPATRLDAEPEGAPIRPRRRFAVLMWIARLLVQIAEASLFAYLLLYFRALDPAVAESSIARLFGAVLAAAVPVAIWVGRRADRSVRPARSLAICALFSGGGLLGMAASTSIQQVIVAYVVFGLATTVFLSLHSGQTLRVLPSRRHRGRDLGVFNLTNTVPSLVMPWLTIAVVPLRGFPTLFAILALLAFTSSALLFTLKRLD
ncbi:MAG: MFS transporter [Sphingomicrobium sp.]